MDKKSLQVLYHGSLKLPASCCIQNFMIYSSNFRSEVRGRMRNWLYWASTARKAHKSEECHVPFWLHGPLSSFLDCVTLKFHKVWQNQIAAWDPSCLALPVTCMALAQASPDLKEFYLLDLLEWLLSWITSRASIIQYNLILVRCSTGKNQC